MTLRNDLHPDAPIERWGVAELELDGPDGTEPTTRAHLSAVFESGATRIEVPGFWDGANRYAVRFSPPEAGTWSYRTASDAAELDGIAGVFDAVGPSADNHGPVQVAAMYHFAHADGTPYRPVGATVYNWIHQPDALVAQTLDAVADAGFDKLRFLVFPQGGAHVEYVPPRFPFARRDDGSWDVERPDPEFFRAVESAVRGLLERGIEADVILYHPYDGGQFGLDRLSEDEDAVYLDHLVARLAAYRNVWWSLANEYDQLERPEERWDRVFQQLVRIDPYGRLRSIHNWIRLYDYNKPWVTHASIQNGWAVAERGRALIYRDAYRKPIMLDEIQYEGNTAERWGDLTARQLVHRFWLATCDGTYASHGESFLDENGSLHIVVGGAFRGESPGRLGFLRRILDEVDGAGLDPIDKWWDETSTVGIPRRHYLRYLGTSAPASWDAELPQGVVGERLEVGDRFAVDVIDTWNMTVAENVAEFALAEVHRNFATAPVTVPLPEGEAIALRIRRIG
ncbi:DUF5060 domain-containing protein [Homoserinibacter sp. GY 40078]|uniref:DUF5060 domain-containing protein n=1 Tax=Homoserinibacter sp. GY 40078 TaxID=2603275 RepID=UPI0021061EA7|nr:DUF5060 domain-containing protein [Homoserinibacter sp. GY 40078]